MKGLGPGGTLPPPSISIFYYRGVGGLGSFPEGYSLGPGSIFCHRGAGDLVLFMGGTPP